MDGKKSEPARIRAVEDYDEDERVTPLGLFHSAFSYAASASVLTATDRKIIWSEEPIRFLYSHAVELYLKSHLRLSGLRVNELRSKNLGHKISKLRARAQELGLQLSEIQEKQLDVLDGAILDRYPAIGMRTIIGLPYLHEICVHLHYQIGPKVYEDAGLTRSVIPLR